jgi:AraC-like DNA-binding protein
MPGRSFTTEHVVGPVLDCLYHFHPEFEVTAIVRGHGFRIVGDHAAEFRAGDLTLIGGNLPHLYHNRIEDSRGADWAQARNLKFTLESLGHGFFELPEMAKIRALLARAAAGLWFPEPTAGQAGALLAELARIPDGAERLLQFLKLLTLLANEPHAKPLSNHAAASLLEAGRSQRLHRVMEWLQANAARKIGLRSAAAIACLSPKSFSRFFKKATRQGFVAYLTEVRLAKACRLLLESDAAISRIAAECGFPNLANFNRRFRRFRNLTPRAYRATVRGYGLGRPQPPTPPEPTPREETT